MILYKNGNPAFEKGSPTYAALLIGLLVLVGTSSVLAQQDTTNGQASTVTYTADYFAEFELFSVTDMLDRIPGITVARGGGPGSSRGSDRRGLGAGGDQVLINGRRIAGKENEGNNQLSRMPASEVDYIEIIRNTSGDLDVRGGAQVINIVLLDSQSSSSVAYEINMDQNWDNTYKPGAKTSLTGQNGAFNYFLSGEIEPRYEFSDSREVSNFPDGSANDRVRRETTRDSSPTTLVGNFGYEFANRDLVHLNLQYEQDDQEAKLDRIIVDDKFKKPRLSLQLERLPRENETWEIGGDYEHIFANESRFKTLFVINEADDLFMRNRYNLENADLKKNLSLSSSERNRERIIRTNYIFNLFNSQFMEIGAERAQTILDTSLQLGLLTGAEISERFGGLSPVTDANGSVEEMRYEYFAIHNWQINNRMSLESTLLFEDSNIMQTGDIYQSRSFNFIRPKIDYRFNITPSLQFRTTIEKDVAQLSFGDFTTSAQTNRGTDDDQNQLEGNPDLTQEQSWLYEANLEYRLPNDAGVLNTNIFFHDLEDIIERIDVSTEDAVLSANGNIGDGERYGINFDGSLRLGFINQPNMLLTMQLNLEDSEVTDPFTLSKRRLSFRGLGEWRFGLRHDIPSLNMNWGFSVDDNFDGERINYDIDKNEKYGGSLSYFSWIEIAGWGGLTYRFEARDSNIRCRTRSRFENRTIGNGTLREIEKSCFTSGRVLALKIRGTF